MCAVLKPSGSVKHKSLSLHLLNAKCQWCKHTMIYGWLIAQTDMSALLQDQGMSK